jgi:hypothetical protein
MHHALADQAAARGLATRDDLADLAQGWRDWAARDDGWFVVVRAEVPARPGARGTALPRY